MSGRGALKIQALLALSAAGAMLGTHEATAATTNHLRMIGPPVVRDGTISLRWFSTNIGGGQQYQILCRTNVSQAWSKTGVTVSTTNASLPFSPASPICFYSVTTDLTPPTVPGGVQVITNNCGSISVRWNAAFDNFGGAGVRSYSVFRNGTLLRQVGAISNSIVDSGLSPLTAYQYAVSATDIVGNESARSTGLSATTPACQNLPPVAVAGSDQTVLAGSLVSLSGAESWDPDLNGSIVAHSWNFGDGSGATGANTTHVYASPGSYVATLYVTDNASATSTDTVVITVNPTTPANQSPVANAGADRSGTVGVAVAFSASNSFDPDGSITSYAWNFGDGTTGSGPTPTHAYTSTGQFTVLLTVRDNASATASDTLLVTIAPPANQPPVANVGSNRNGTVGAALTFSAAGSFDPDGTISTFAWSFGDGTTGSGAAASHAYTTPGQYAVQLVVTDNAGSKGSNMLVASIASAGNQLPVAVVGPNQSGTVGAALSFSAAGSYDPDGTISSYAWNFGDSGTATGASVSHAFSAAGQYTVRLTVTDNAGGRSSNSLVATISTPANQLPVAVVGPNQSGTVGAALSFSAAGSYDPDGTISTYAWNFGDGGTATGASVSHAFSAAGQYTVRLTVTDNAGGRSSNSLVATISTPANQLPVAVVGPNRSGTVGALLSFSSTGSYDPDGSISSFAWNFGDGATANGAAVSHAFAAAGQYTVRLTVTDNAGGRSSNSLVATISQPVNQMPVAVVGPNQNGTVGALLTFSSTGSYDPDGTISSFAWNFGDGTTGSGATASHAYSAAGQYTVRLTVTDNAGGTASSTLVATIAAAANQPPVAEAGAAQSGAIGEAIPFSGAASRDPDGTLTSYSWNFGDGSTGTGANVSHAYAAQGTYTVRLTVTDNAGATATDTTTATVSGTLLPGQFLSATNFGSTYVDVGLAVVVDQQGSVILGGSYLGRPFLAKRLRSGAVDWTFVAGDGGGGAVQSVAVDGNGDILVTGNFIWTQDLGGGPLTSAGGYDIFVAKYSSAGTHLWSKRFGGTRYSDSPTETGYGIAVDLTDNSVLVTGTFDSALNFGGGTLTPTASMDMFLTKFRSDGGFVWAKQVGGASSTYARALAVDDTGNIFVTGWFYSPVRFGTALVANYGGLNPDLFLAKYSPAGAHLWVNHYGQAGSDCRGMGVVVDAAGDVVVAGNSAGPNNLGGALLSNRGMDDIVLAKYSGQSGAHRWSKSLGGPRTDSLRGLAVDPDGRITLVGFFNASIDFGGASVTRFAQNAYVVNYQPEGGFRWAQAFGTGTDEASAVAASRDGRVVVVGRYGTPLPIGPVTLPVAGAADIFEAEFAR